MEILYVTTMAAIFVLCLALLVTARRILQSSPLSSGDLALSRMYETPVMEDFPANWERPEISFEAPADARPDAEIAESFEAEDVEMDPIMATWVPAPTSNTARVTSATFLSEAMAHENMPMATSTVIAAEEPLVSQSSAQLPASGSARTIAEEKIPSQSREKKSMRSRKPLPAGYKHTLECLLLGVSVFVLFTQRGALRSRLLQATHHRVA